MSYVPGKSRSMRQVERAREQDVDDMSPLLTIKSSHQGIINRGTRDGRGAKGNG